MLDYHYFEDLLLREEWSECDKLYKVANAFAAQVRRVEEEDKTAIEANRLHFDIHTLIGGQMCGDPEHMLYLIYPEGNWVSVTKGTPYHIIGERAYGKPVTAIDVTTAGQPIQKAYIGFDPDEWDDDSDT